MADGWIKLHRKLKDSACFQNEKLLKVWVWCLLKATHSDRKQMVGRKEVDILPGQFPTGRLKAASELNMKPSTAWEYLLLLQSQGNIDIKSNNKFSIVTVVNWGTYQLDDEETRQQNRQQINNKSTTNQQQIDTNKNDKNVKNDKKYINTSHSLSVEPKEDSLFEEFWESYPRQINKTKALKAWNARRKEKVDPNDLILAARNYATARQGKDQQYTQHPATFLGPTKPYLDYIKPQFVQEQQSQKSGNKSFDALEEWDKMTEGLL